MSRLFEAALSPSVLDRPLPRSSVVRWEVFADKVEQGEPFELVRGGEVILGFADPDDNESFALDIRVLKTGALVKRGASYLVPVVGSDPIPLSALLKTVDFGGLASDHAEKHEVSAIASLNDQIEEQGGFVLLRTGRGVVEVTRFEKTTGFPKSDFHGLDEQGKEVFWISHKAGKSPRDFGQFSGMSSQAGLNIHQHPEVQEFADAVRLEFPDGFPRATTVGRPIDDTTLMSLAMFGKDFGGPFGSFNVNVLVQGDPILAPVGSEFEILGTGNTFMNSDIPEPSYLPTLMAMFKPRSDFGIPNARFSIYPSGGRSWRPI
jgi:hypothetical protein